VGRLWCGVKVDAGTGEVLAQDLGADDDESEAGEADASPGAFKGSAGRT